MLLLPLRDVLLLPLRDVLLLPLRDVLLQQHDTRLSAARHAPVVRLMRFSSRERTLDSCVEGVLALLSRGDGGRACTAAARVMLAGMGCGW